MHLFVEIVESVFSPSLECSPCVIGKMRSEKRVADGIRPICSLCNLTQRESKRTI
jgi:hypothetical protein